MLQRIILSYLITLPLLMQAQGTWTTYNTTNSGLPDNNIFDVEAGISGDIWVSTQTGLAHFDGVNWTVYTTSNSGIPRNDVGQIEVNDTGSVIMLANGLTIFDGVNWTSYNYTNTSILLGKVSSIEWEPGGKLWGTTQNVSLVLLFSFDGTTWETHVVFSGAPLAGEPVKVHTIDIFGNKWLSFYDQLMKFDGDTFTAQTSPWQMTALACDTFNHPWAAGIFIIPNFGPTEYKGVSYYDGFSWPRTYDATNSALPNNMVNNVIIDNANVKWFGTPSGLVRLEDTTWTIYNTSNSAIPNDNIRKVMIDDAGNKWIATWGGGLAEFSDGGAPPIGSGSTISGAILTEVDIPVQGVTVTLSGDENDSAITAADGRYSFRVEQGGTYSITPSKNNDITANNGISTSDVLLMRRHTLGIAPLPSPYKIIAAAEANADSDTNVSTLDILRTRELILGNATSFPTNRLWQFVSSDYVFPDASNPFPFDKTRTYTNITSNQSNQDFIGIKLGDVNGSWDAGVP